MDVETVRFVVWFGEATRDRDLRTHTLDRVSRDTGAPVSLTRCPEGWTVRIGEASGTSSPHAWWALLSAVVAWLLAGGQWTATAPA